VSLLVGKEKETSSKEVTELCSEVQSLPKNLEFFRIGKKSIQKAF
jgi:hypothetical protein